MYVLRMLGRVQHRPLLVTVKVRAIYRTLLCDRLLKSFQTGFFYRTLCDSIDPCA